MKKLILCDSGLGGLDIAAPFFRKKEKAEWDMIYINGCPDPKFGYNDLAESAMQEAVFRAVLESMERFSPALCMIACNTLSIVWRKLSAHYQPSFPVMGIIDEAVKGGAAQIPSGSPHPADGYFMTIDQYTDIKNSAQAILDALKEMRL